MPYSPVGAIGLFKEEPEEQCECLLGERLEILFQVLVQQEKKDKLTTWFFHLSTSRFEPGLTQSHTVAKQAR